MFSLHILHRLKDRNNRRPPRPSRAGMTLHLESLEERWLPNGAISAASPPTLAFYQAAVALVSDGYNLGVGLVNQNVFRIDQTDAFFPPLADLNASIAVNSPTVGSTAPLFVLAGEIVGADVQYQLQLQSVQLF